MNYKMFVGIDISKKTIDVALKKEKQMVHDQFSNDLKGFKRMIKWALSETSVPKESWFFCMEHTGIYGLSLAFYLQENEFNFCFENPYHIKHSMGIQRRKNDKADAKMIARYASMHNEELSLSKFPGKTIIELQALLAYRKRLVKTHTALKVPANELSVFKGNQESSHIKKETKSLLKCVKNRIEKANKQIEDLLKKDKPIAINYQLAQSVKGIGPITAAYMIIYTQNFTIITDSRKFASYCGIAPFERTSGSSIRGKTSVSNLANKTMKTLLNNGAWNAVKFDKELRIYYERKLEEGKHKLSVINAVKNKMVSRVFAVVKRGTPYVSLANHA